MLTFGSPDNLIRQCLGTKYLYQQYIANFRQLNNDLTMSHYGYDQRVNKFQVAQMLNNGLIGK